MDQRSLSRALPLLLLVSCTYGARLPSEISGETFSPLLTSAQQSSLLGNPSAQPPEVFPTSNPTERVANWDYDAVCMTEGVFPIQGSCNGYYECREASNKPGLFSLYLRFCPEGMAFHDAMKSCVQREKVTRPDCQDIYGRKEQYATTSYREPPQHLNRKKRFAIIPALTGLLSHPLAKAAAGLFGTRQKSRESRQSQEFLKHLEGKLIGIDGKLKNVQLSVLESQTENRKHAEIIYNVVKQGHDESQASFTVTQNLIKHGILENQIHTAKIQGLISQQTTNIKNKFARLQVTLGELKTFINNEIAIVKEDIKRGFNSISDSIDQSRVEPLVSTLLTTIKEFNLKSNHIQNLPEKNRIDAIKRRGGYLDYLESSTIQETLQNIIQQNLAIPKQASDITAVFILDLLVHGLQVHAHMMSSIVLSNSYLAAKALEEINLEEFNTYMLRVTSSAAKLNQLLSTGSVQGIFNSVKKVLENVQKLPYASDIIGFVEHLNELNTEIQGTEYIIQSLVEDTRELSEPGTIKGKPNFKSTSSPVPIASWEKGKNVYYAIQYVSGTGLSRVGAWSAPYSIGDKANPTIEIPNAPQGVTRVVYRKFNEDQPELVAVINNPDQKLFRDIDRDLLNAAARSNEDQAVLEVTSLVDNGADVNTFIGNKMTPLHFAAKNGNARVMEILIAKGANIHAKTSDNEEPLHFAALFGTAEGIEYLISKGAGINAQTRSLGLSPLHIAVANNHVDATKTLINKGAFINIKDNNGLTPLHMSVTGDGDTTEVLLQSDTIDVNVMANDGLTPLHYAARSSNEVFVIKLLQHANTDANPQTTSLLSPLHLAAIGNNEIAISELIKHGVPSAVQDAKGSTAMHYAAFYGSPEATMALLQYDESLINTTNSDENTPADIANENNEEKIVRLLSGENPSEIFGDDPQTALEPTTPKLSDEVRKGFKQLVAANCSTNTVEELARGSEETCAHIGNVESYVNLVMTMVPLEIYYEGYDEFSDIFRNYDHDLNLAQGHAKIWRNGDSIVQGIRQTFDLARIFEPEFTRKYKINQERIVVIKENADQAKIINQTKDEIKTLETQLAEATEAMEQVKVQAVLVYFQKNINDINTQIAEKKRMLEEDFTLIHELEELVAFLEFVRRDSDKIRAVALKTKEKIEIFRANLQNDKGAFTRHGRVADETLTKLEEEAIKHNKALAENKRKQEQLMRKIAEDSNQVKLLFDKINESHRKLREKRRELMAKMKKARRRRRIGAFLTPVLVGFIMIANAKSDEQVYIKELQTAMVNNKEEVENIQLMIKHNRDQLRLHQELMANSTSNSDNIRKEMTTFITLDGDLKNMAEKAETLVEALTKAIAGVENIQHVFEGVTQKLTEMIAFASEAKTEAERLNARFFIYNELSLLECNWRDVYLKVMNLDDCTKNFEILYPE